MDTVTILQDLIRIDTQNPPGRERAAAQYIDTYCRKLGIETEIYSFGEDRSNVIVRIGAQNNDTLVILGHLDVVKADTTAWSYDPFAAEIHDGYLYGRGALDMKYFIAASLNVIKQLKRIEEDLKTGIMFLFTADEERGSTFGMQKLLEDEKLRTELSGKTVLNEGGGFALFHNDKCYYLFEAGQKSVGKLEITIPAMEGSDPYFLSLDHEAILAKVINRLEELTFEATEGLSSPLTQLLTSGGDISEDVDTLLTTMSTSLVTPTLIEGGARNKLLNKNEKVRVSCDCRILPHIDEIEVVKKIEEVLSDLPVSITMKSFAKGYKAEIDKDMLALLEYALKEHDPEIAGLIPFITPGSNDGKYLKPLGSSVIGFAPLSRDDQFIDIMPRIHGIDERISIPSIEFCAKVLFSVCREYLMRRK